VSVAVNGRPRQAVDVRRLAMWSLAFVLPIETFVVLAETPGVAPGYNRVAVAMFLDVPLVILALGALPAARRRVRERRFTLGVVTAAALFAMAAVAWLFHPSLRGLVLLGRLLAGALLVVEIAGLDRDTLRHRLAGPLLVAGSLQGVLAVAQSAAGGPLGIGFGELRTLYVFGDVTAGSGTLRHPYVLAAFAALVVTVGIAAIPMEKGRRWWLAGIALTAMSLGVTFARSAVAGLVFSAAALLVAARRERRRYAGPTAAFLAGALLPAVLFAGGWADRVDQSTTADADEFSSGRLTHVEQSLDVIAESPLVGVGPARYSEVLEARHDPRLPDAVHFVPLLVAAEDGAYAGVVFLALMVLLAVRARRTSAAAFAVAMALAGFMAFDKLTYLHPNGLVMFAIWLGMLDHLAAPPGRPEESTSS
jgi:O-antigen ligase